MGFAFVPMALIVGAIHVGLLAFTLGLALLEFPFINRAGCVALGAGALRLIFMPAAFEFIAVFVFHHSLAMAAAMLKAAPVLGAVGVGERTVAMWLIFQPLAFVSGTIGPNVFFTF